MNARDRYWRTYTSIKHKNAYFHYHSLGSASINAAINAICLLTSASSIAGWAIWSDSPLVWAILIGAAQIIQVLKPVFPYAKQLAAFKYFLPQTDNLLLEIDHHWRVLDSYDDNHINDLITGFEKQYADCVHACIGDSDVKPKKRYERNAEKDCNLYFEHRYGN